MFDRLIADPARLPKAGDAERAAVGLERWREAGAGDPETRRFAEAVANNSTGRAWLDGVETLGITAGASAPEQLIADLIQAVRDRFDATVIEDDGAREDVVFKLPRVLTA